MNFFIQAVSLCLLTTSSAQQVFDYIIVGGGTAGLVVANRLTEIEAISVLVIEAGASALDSAISTNAMLYGTYPGPIRNSHYAVPAATEEVKRLDWGYTTIPQVHATNEVEDLPAGKGIGGSSLVNGMVYTRADSAQLDSWERAGNSGWNWTSLFPYYKKGEHFQVPNAIQVSAGASYDSAFHGFQGLLATGFSHSQLPAKGNFLGNLNDSYQAVGVPVNADMNGGGMRGFSRIPSTLNGSSGSDVRADSGRSYYYPFSSRSNLKLVQNSLASKILWASDTDADGNYIASAVEVNTGSGTIVYNASKEVIVSCGTYGSPALLERSGIGNSSILSDLKIDVKVDLPGVGENLMDQMSTNFTHKLPTDIGDLGAGGCAAYLNISDIFGLDTLGFAANTSDALSTYAATITGQNNDSASADSLSSLMRLQYTDIFDNQIPVVEVLHHASGDVLTSEFWGTLPFARGNVHISTPSVQSLIINPNYWMFEYDTTVMIRAARYLRILFATSPLNQYVELSPGTDALPLNATDDDYEGWLKREYHTAYHGIGTCIMLPQTSGGVTSNTTMVYGTANVRVVDASIIPFQTNGHTQATVYALAEKASDAIKKDGGFTI